MKPLLLISTLALALPASSQTWFRVAGETDVITSTAPITYRYGTAIGKTYAGVDCSVAQCWNQQTGTLTRYVVSYQTLGDSAPGLSKEFDVLETSTPQIITVNGGTVTVPALPPVYPPIAFAPNTAYSFTVSNIPPAGSALSFALTIQVGSVSVPLICTYSTTTATATVQSAAFSCIPLPIK